MVRKKVLNYISENKMIDKGQSIVIGVSGGADSMCLLSILLEMREELELKLLVVHVHHGIRGETADRDARYVEEYCKKNNVPCMIKYADVPRLAVQWGMSHEEAGRQVRYSMFQEALGAIAGDGQGKIAVAHNADDNAETILLNMFRGSGLKGMTGIKPLRDNIIRPILCLTREEIETYNDENGIIYVQDETNHTEEYTRNRIRLSILPKAREINARASQHINMTAEALSLIDDYIECELDKIYKEYVREDDHTAALTVKLDGFANIHKAMQLELVKSCLYKVAGQAKDITKQHIDSVMSLFELSVGKKVSLPYDMIGIRQYAGVCICKGSSTTKADKEEGEVAINGVGEYHITLAGNNAILTVCLDTFNSEIFEENQYTKWIDCDIMKCNLQVRTRRNGDYIILDGQGSRKKLKDFFIDKKIPKEMRDNILLVANGNEIIWIIGYRLSGAYKVSKASKNIARLHMDYER